LQNNLNNRVDLLALNSDLEREASALGTFNSIKNAGNLELTPFNGLGEIVSASTKTFD
jgi:hypothetical protein